MSPYGRCSNRHKGRYLSTIEGCFSCDESGHKIINCPKTRTIRREGKQVSPSGLDENYHKKNWFYVIQDKNNQE